MLEDGKGRWWKAGGKWETQEAIALVGGFSSFGSSVLLSEIWELIIKISDQLDS